MVGLALSAFCGTALMGCNSGKDRFRSGAISSVIGEDNLKPVTTGDEDFFRALGFLHTGCTATHLGGGYSLTAGHCVGGATKDVIYHESCDPRLQGVTWGALADNPKGIMVSSCREIVMREFHDGIDYAVIRVSPDPGYRIAPNFDEHVVYRGRDISIFSYPKGRPLEWSGPCKVVDINNKNSNIYHSCDTESGSSGAPILDTYDEIIGVHAFNLGDLNGGTGISNTSLEELY